MNKQIIQKFNVPGPRYTSYPTAPEWQDLPNDQLYSQKLKNFAQTGKPLSVYVHIPYCQKLCYFCGCMVKIRANNQESYAAQYVDLVLKELELIQEQIPNKPQALQLHWGGGTPNYLPIKEMSRLWNKLSEVFTIDPEGEIAIEVDPRTVSLEQLDHLRSLGFNRISMGIQDFNPAVQQAINRIQPFELVQRIYEHCRSLQFQSVNFDLIYGLPLQDLPSFKDTVNKVIQLKPDRIALYSFAHVPWLKKHQTIIKEDDLPGADLKLDLFVQSRELFLSNGYEAIAMDHFALKDDEMANAFRQGVLHRNFMGYTLRYTEDFLGLGLSSIGYMGNMFVQNQKELQDYAQCLEQNRLPVHRGKDLSQDDLIRQWLINQLMCRFEVDFKEFEQRFSVNFNDYFCDQEQHIAYCLEDKLITMDEAKLKATELGKMFIRNVCMGFDWYLAQKTGHKRFSQTI